MTRSFVVVVGVGMAGLAVVLLQAFDEVPLSHLAVGPSFEGPVGGNGLPHGWSGPSTKEGSRYRHEIVGDARTGKQALVLEGAGGWAVVSNVSIPLDRTQRYSARGWVKVEGDADAAADVKFHYIGPAGYLGQSRIGFVNPRTPGWQTITVTDQAELFPTATHVQLAVALAGKGKAWFDDVEMSSTGRVGEAEATPVNHVGNGDMEDVAADRPAGYYVFSEGEAECRTSEERPASGKRCLSLRSTGEWATAGCAAIPVADHDLAVSGRIRVASGEARLAIRYLDDTYQMVGNSESPAVAGREWQTVSLRTDFAKYPKATTFTVAASIAGEGSAEFDDFRAIRLDER